MVVERFFYFAQLGQFAVDGLFEIIYQHLPPRFNGLLQNVCQRLCRSMGCDKGVGLGCGDACVGFDQHQPPAVQVHRVAGGEFFAPSAAEHGAVVEEEDGVAAQARGIGAQLFHREAEVEQLVDARESGGGVCRTAAEPRPEGDGFVEVQADACGGDLRLYGACREEIRCCPGQDLPLLWQELFQDSFPGLCLRCCFLPCPECFRM